MMPSRSHPRISLVLFVLWWCCCLGFGEYVLKNGRLSAQAKPTNDDYDPDMFDDDPDMQKDDYTEEEEEYEDDPKNGYDAADPPPSITTKSKLFVVKNHDNITLPCVVKGNADVYVIMWKKENQIIFQDSFSLGNYPAHKYKLDETNLTITDIDKEDLGQYSCEVPLPERPLKVEHTLSYETPAKILSIWSHHNTNEYKTGDTLELSCNVSGAPLPKVTWSLKGQRIEAKGSNLIIENIGMDNAGNYQCLADNGVGNPDHTSITITIKHKPIVTMEKVISNVRDGTYDVVLKCVVHSVPASIITWRKDGSLLDQSRYKLQKKNAANAVHINGVRDSDMGRFSCRAVNEMGENEQHYVLTNRPLRPNYQGGDHARSGKEVTLLWYVESMYDILEHVLLYRKEDEQQWEEAKPDVTPPDGHIYSIKYTLEHLHVGTYHVKVKSKNEHGWSDESKVITFNVTHHHGHKKQHTPMTNEVSEQSSERRPDAALEARSGETKGATPQPSSSRMIAPTAALFCLTLLSLFVRH